MEINPCVPSLPVPDKIIPILFSPYSCEIESNKIRIDNLIIVNQIESVWQLLDRYIDLKVEIARIEMEENENKNIYA